MLLFVFACGQPAASQTRPQATQRWIPTPGMTWQWQLTDALDLTVPVHVYDLDLFETSAETVQTIKQQDQHVICYVNVGAWEEWRPDANAFPSSIIGKDYAGWAGEKWLDIRQINLLAPIMEQRFDQCRDKGFDGIEPDNLDNYENDTGFNINRADQLAYLNWLADAAHARGLSIGLKNVPEFVPDVLSKYDWALTESCFKQGWCDQLTPFIEANKAVFAAEYTDEGSTTAQFCPLARQLRISAILKNRNLDAYRDACTSSTYLPLIRSRTFNTALV